MHLRHPVWLLALIATAASAQHKGKTSWAEWSDAVGRARQKLLARTTAERRSLTYPSPQRAVSWQR